jgi:hypothetical protein
MGRADFLDLGNPNKICDFCGQKFKASEVRETWDHYFVCDYDFELRQPQDKLQSFPDKQTIDDPRPESVSVTTEWNGAALVNGTNSPSINDFLDTNEVTSDDLGNGNGDIDDVI